MSAELVVVQHHPRTGPESFLEVLEGRAHLVPWRIVDLGAGDPLPTDLDAVAGLVSLGAPMGAPDDPPASWQLDEQRLLCDAVDADVPVLGVCLGAQLLATALGGEVAQRERAEVGFVPLWRTESAAGDDVAAGWPDGTPALFFHQNEVTRLPDDAELVLTGSDGAAAWRRGSALAVQFHPEVTVEQLQGWLSEPGAEAVLDAAGVDVEQLLEEARRRERFTVAHGRSLLGRFIDGPVRTRVT